MESTRPGNAATELAALDAQVNALLPARYQHCATVAPTSMGSAGVRYGPDGRVAWGSIWTTFCDLALAGGPPHRGKLLEPVPEARVRADPDRYNEVVAEIARAIELTAGLPVVAGHSPGWVGVRCTSPGQAAWLQFAVTAENVSARRRGADLQLPAGPAFEVEKEIKNVVVSLAKACHYWDGHLSAAQQDLAGDLAWEPATPADVAAAPSQYDAAVAEVQRALRPSGRATLPRRHAGWLGLQASDEDEAAWLLRAVLSDRVLARREARVLYLPITAIPDADRAARVGHAFCHAWRLRPAAATGRIG